MECIPETTITWFPGSNSGRLDVQASCGGQPRLSAPLLRSAYVDHAMVCFPNEFTGMANQSSARNGEYSLTVVGSEHLIEEQPDPTYDVLTGSDGLPSRRKNISAEVRFVPSLRVGPVKGPPPRQERYAVISTYQLDQGACMPPLSLATKVRCSQHCIIPGYDVLPGFLLCGHREEKLPPLTAEIYNEKQVADAVPLWLNGQYYTPCTNVSWVSGPLLCRPIYIAAADLNEGDTPLINGTILKIFALPVLYGHSQGRDAVFALVVSEDRRCIQCAQLTCLPDGCLQWDWVSTPVMLPSRHDADKENTNTLNTRHISIETRKGFDVRIVEHGSLRGRALLSIYDEEANRASFFKLVLSVGPLTNRVTRITTELMKTLQTPVPPLFGVAQEVLCHLMPTCTPPALVAVWCDQTGASCGPISLFRVADLLRASQNARGRSTSSERSANMAAPSTSPDDFVPPVVIPFPLAEHCCLVRGRQASGRDCAESWWEITVSHDHNVSVLEVRSQDLLPPGAVSTLVSSNLYLFQSVIEVLRVTLGLEAVTSLVEAFTIGLLRKECVDFSILVCDWISASVSKQTALDRPLKSTTHDDTLLEIDLEFLCLDQSDDPFHLNPYFPSSTTTHTSEDDGAKISHPQSLHTFASQLSRNQSAIALLGLHLLAESLRIYVSSQHAASHLCSRILFPAALAHGWSDFCEYYAFWYPSCSYHRGEDDVPDDVSGAAVQGPLLPLNIATDTFGIAIEPYVKSRQPPSLCHFIEAIIIKGGPASESASIWPRLTPKKTTQRVHCGALSATEALVDIYQRVFSTSELNEFEQIWKDTLVDELYHIFQSSPELAESIKKDLLPGFALPLQEALLSERLNPRYLESSEWLEFIQRPDIAQSRLMLGVDDSAALRDAHFPVQGIRRALIPDPVIFGEDESVSLDASFFRIWGDARLDIVQRMLSSARPLQLFGTENVEVHRATLAVLFKRTIVAPISRGIFTFGTQDFKLQDTIPIPPLNFDGRTGDGIVIRIEAPTSEATVWSQFHNGCAAGLRYLNRQSTISRSWINYQARDDESPAAAGLLLSLGLLGHLRCMQPADMYCVLARRNDLSTIGLLLGLSCTYRGTENESIFKCIALHIESLTQTNDDLEVAQSVQMTSLVCMGLLKQSSCDRFLTEMLIGEIARLPSDQHCTTRNSYALGAGIALGLVLLGKGLTHGPLVIDRLLALTAGKKREGVHSRLESVVSFNERFQGHPAHEFISLLMSENTSDTSNICNSILEGDAYNTAVCAPAALAAIGLLYLQTDDVFIASRVAPVNALAEVHSMAPDTCLLRVLMAGLINWSGVEANRNWIYERSPIPQCLVQEVLVSGKIVRSDICTPDEQYLLLCLAHGIAGSCLAMGLRFVGQMNAEARATILAELKGFADGKLGSSGIILSPLHTSSGAFESCISSCAIALGLVCAGRGDLQALSILRRLHERTNVAAGAHLPVSMAIGFLFFGGGHFTFNNSRESIAMLLVSCFPLWIAQDLEVLQSLRHLYALAARPSLLEVVDCETGESVSVSGTVSLETTVPVDEEPPSNGNNMNATLDIETPCLLPNITREVHITDPKYLPISVNVSGSLAAPGHGPLVLKLLRCASVSVKGFAGNVVEASILLCLQNVTSFVEAGKKNINVNEYENAILSGRTLALVCGIGNRLQSLSQSLNNDDGSVHESPPASCISPELLFLVQDAVSETIARHMSIRDFTSGDREAQARRNLLTAALGFRTVQSLMECVRALEQIYSNRTERGISTCLNQLKIGLEFGVPLSSVKALIMVLSPVSK